jgi:hypothetical protein
MPVSSITTSPYAATGAHSNTPQVVVAAKSTTPEADLAKLSPFPPDPNSPQSTITTVAREITLAGGEATALRVDTTDYASIQQLIAKTIEAGPFLSSPPFTQSPTTTPAPN